VQGEPDGIVRNLGSPTCFCSQRGEPNRELRGPQRQQGHDRVSQQPLPIQGWSGQSHHHPPLADTLPCLARWPDTASQPHLGFPPVLSITRVLSITQAGALHLKQLPAQHRRCLVQPRHLGVGHRPCPIPSVSPHQPPRTPPARRFGRWVLPRMASLPHSSSSCGILGVRRS